MTQDSLRREATSCSRSRLDKGKGEARRDFFQHRQRCRRLAVASWNVRTLVEDVGDARICRKGRREYGDERIGAQTVDRKLDLLVRELKRYGVSVAGIQETKWFGNDVWVADGYTLLHSGRPLPSKNDRAVRNEGVGIVLDTKATAP